MRLAGIHFVTRKSECVIRVIKNAYKTDIHENNILKIKIS